MIVVIDGPAGSGKSSTARAFSRRTGFTFLDSGAFYRAVTLIYIAHHSNPEVFFEALDASDLKVSFDDGVFRVFLNGTEVTDEIRSPQVSGMVSTVAAMPRCRDFVNRHLREFVQTGTYIADGRDLGTVVFPEADFKFYFDASVETRARRRLDEMTSGGTRSDYNAVVENIRSRDKTDAERDTAPLRKADDAIVVNTETMTLEDQVEFLMNVVKD
ncbi:MAG: cytidylate kinase Cmk [Bacteroidetes bacterium HLUCCA01]|nr:MAG: cytidylate kinase Cmk [Bacteroidetes bacterium HLUCCA01]